jgi:predicted TIM-barrel fold metal-dependent hydrolase
VLIDCHCHVVPEKSVTHAEGGTFTTPDELLSMLDARGIDRAVLLPIVSPEAQHRITTSEDILAIARAHPTRFIPFCNVDPRQDKNGPSADLSRLLAYYRDAGCRGVGEVTANLAWDDPQVTNFLRCCQAVGLPVTFHIAPRFGNCYGLVDDLHLPKLEAALKQFPDLTFIGHSQPFWSEMGPEVTVETRNTYPKGPVREGGRTPELFARYPNLYGDLSAGSGFNAVSRDPDYGIAFLERFQDRLLFGTDICAPTNETPLVDYLRQVRANGRLSAAASEKIAWRNANRLFRLGLE